jgi:cytochrome c-type biogenesis protein CcmF
MSGDMEITEILLLASAFVVLLDIVNIRGKKETRFLDNRLPTVAVACALVIISYLYLAWAFVTNNFRVNEVYSYSSSGLSLVERLYASWASSGGSWLFLSFLFASGYLIIRLAQGENKEHGRVYQFIDILFVFILVVVLIQSPLKTLTFTPLDGRGLNPLLRTPWMLIHPPIVFIGYVLALFSLSFVFGTAESSHRISRGLAASAWLFLTMGIAIGGLWAYEVLGWGGYWGGDPVETSSLVPWITLTAYFHLVTQLTGKKSNSQDFMLMVTSALILFASAITRGGLAVSVHAFGSSPIGYVLLALMGFVAAYFVVAKRKRGYALFRFEANTDTVYNAAMSLSFLSLIMITFVCMWGIIFPIINSGVTGSDVSMDAEFFNRWTYPFALLFLVSLVGCHLHEKLTLKTYTGVIGGLVGLGLVSAFMGFPTGNMLANLGIPITLFAMGSVLYSLAVNLTRKASPLLASRELIHLGTTLIMAGILIGSSSATDYGEIIGSPGSSMAVGDMTLDFGEFTIIEPSSTVLTSLNPQRTGPESAGLVIPVTVHRGGDQASGEVTIYYYYLYGIVSRPTVIRSLGYDTYLVLHQSQNVYMSLGHILTGSPVAPSEFVMSVMQFPLMNLIWAGTLLMCVGIIVPILNARKKTPQGE